MPGSAEDINAVLLHIYRKASRALRGVNKELYASLAAEFTYIAYRLQQIADVRMMTGADESCVFSHLHSDGSQHRFSICGGFVNIVGYDAF
jgi:hypothetical protein